MERVLTVQGGRLWPTTMEDLEKFENIRAEGEDLSAAGSAITVAGYAPERLDVPGDEIVPWNRQREPGPQPIRGSLWM